MVPYLLCAETVRTHFERFGELTDAVIMRDPISNRSRGFGFVVFKDPQHLETALDNGPHVIDGRDVRLLDSFILYVSSPAQIDVKYCSAQGTKGRGQRTTKLYVSKLPLDVNKDKLKELFSQHGTVVDTSIINDRGTGASRGE